MVWRECSGWEDTTLHICALSVPAANSHHGPHPAPFLYLPSCSHRKKQARHARVRVCVHEYVHNRKIRVSNAAGSSTRERGGRERERGTGREGEGEGETERERKRERERERARAHLAPLFCHSSLARRISYALVCLFNAFFRGLGGVCCQSLRARVQAVGAVRASECAGVSAHRWVSSVGVARTHADGAQARSPPSLQARLCAITGGFTPQRPTGCAHAAASGHPAHRAQRHACHICARVQQDRQHTWLSAHMLSLTFFVSGQPLRSTETSTSVAKQLGAAHASAQVRVDVAARAQARASECARGRGGAAGPLRLRRQARGRRGVFASGGPGARAQAWQPRRRAGAHADGGCEADAQRRRLTCGQAHDGRGKHRHKLQSAHRFRLETATAGDVNPFFGPFFLSHEPTTSRAVQERGRGRGEGGTGGRDEEEGGSARARTHRGVRGDQPPQPLCHRRGQGPPPGWAVCSLRRRRAPRWGCWRRREIKVRARARE